MELMIEAVDIGDFSLQFLLKEFLYSTMFSRHHGGPVVHLAKYFVGAQSSLSEFGNNGLCQSLSIPLLCRGYCQKPLSYFTGVCGNKPKNNLDIFPAGRIPCSINFDRIKLIPHLFNNMLRH